MKRFLRTLIILVSLSTILNGCGLIILGGAAAAGAGTVLYVKGELKASEAVPLDKAYAASEKAIEDLGFYVVENKKDQLEGKITARTATDKKVTVKVERVNNELTDIKIRVGTFGDEPLSRQILQKIQDRL